MATYEQLMDAARRADAAGEEGDARRLLELARSAQTGEPAPAPQPAEPSFGDRAMSALDTADGIAAAAFDGVRQGVANVAGFPVDAVNMSPMLLNLLPGEQGMKPFSDDPVGGSASIDRALRGGLSQEPIIPDYQPDGMAERVVNRVGEELGSVAVPVGGVVAGANRVGKTGARAMQQPGNNWAQRQMGQALETAATNPGRFVGKETAYATAAGTGAAGARELASDGDPNTETSYEVAADLIGAILGYGGLGAVEAGGRAATDAGTAMFGKGDRLTREAVTDELAKAMGAPIQPSGAADTTAAASQMRNAPRVGDTVPGFQDSAADASQNPGLATLEYNRRNGENAGLYNQRRQQNQIAADEAMQDVSPGGTPGQYGEAARVQRDDITRQMQDYLDELTVEYGDTTESLVPKATSEARGQVVRGSLEEALENARAQEREAWSAVAGEVDPAPLAQQFDSLYGGLTQSERRIVDDARAAIETPNGLAPTQSGDPIVSAVLGPDGRPFTREATPVSEMTDLNEITSLRSEFTDAARKANAAGEPNKARILNQFVETIDGYLDTAPGIAEPLANARAVSRDLNDRFTRRGDPIADSLATRPSGGPAVPDSSVAGQFVQPDAGRAQNIDRLLQEADSTEVRAALDDQIVETVRNKGLLEKPDRLEKFLGEYSRVFEKFPELRDQFGTAAGLKRKIDETTRGQAEMNRNLFEGGSAVGKYLKYGDERAVDAMGTVLNAKDPAAAADELLGFVNDAPDAVQGARSAFWQALKRRTQSKGTSTRTGETGQAWRFQDLHRFVNDPANAAVMERLYRDDPEQLGRIRELADALQRTDFAQTGKVPGASGTPQSLAGNEILPSTETLGAYGFAYQRGQVGLPFIGLRLASTMARRATMRGRSKEFQQLIDEALLNPELAETLLRENNPANAAALARAAKGALGVRAAWVDDLVAPEDGEDEDDTMEAIQR